jgi:hypothetical protein
MALQKKFLRIALTRLDSLGLAATRLDNGGWLKKNAVRARPFVIIRPRLTSGCKKSRRHSVGLARMRSDFSSLSLVLRNKDSKRSFPFGRLRNRSAAMAQIGPAQKMLCQRANATRRDDSERPKRPSALVEQRIRPLPELGVPILFIYIALVDFAQAKKCFESKQPNGRQF